MTPPLPACSAVFQRQICPHMQLFAKEYKRCFPHCCPYHVDRSYCGSPVEVLVQFASPSGASLPSGQTDHDLDPSFHLANAFVFARFESENDDALHDGPHSLRDLRSASQRDEEAGPLWIEGIQKWQSDGSQAARNSNRFTPTTFTLNGQPFDKWYHHWESGANRSQRATRHALKAYVFYPSSVSQRSLRPFERSCCVQQDQTLDGALELLCVVSSPLFTVSSYRRSSSNASAAVVDTVPAHQPVAIDTAAFRVHHVETNESHRGFRRQQDHEESRARPLRYQEHRHIDIDQALSPPEEQEEEEAAPRSNQRFSGSPQARQSRQRGEYLDLQLLSPEEAAQSAPFLHSQIQSREPRLVFDRKRRRAGSYQCPRDPTSRNGDDRADEGEHQGPALHRGIATKTLLDRVEQTTRPVETPPSSIHPMRSMAKEANEFDSQLKTLHRPVESRQATVHQLTDLAVIHFVASRVTARRGSSDLPTVLASAIAEFWRYDRGEALQLANVVYAVAGGSGEANATRFRRRSEGSSSEEVLQALTRVCIWTLSPENLKWMQGLLAACHPVIHSSSVGSSAGADEEEENHLRSAFLTCAELCWDRLDEFLQIHQATRPTIRSVRELSDAVIGFVFSDPTLEELRPELRGVLQRCAAFFHNRILNMSTTHDCGWNLAIWRQFVAYVEEGCTRNQYSGRGFPTQSPNVPPSRWTGEWMLQPGSLAVDFRGGTLLVHEDTSLYRDVPSLWTSCRPIAQLLRLKLAVAGGSLYFISLPWSRDDDKAWTQLLCDGRVHTAAFNAALDLAPCGFGGDYVAYRLEQASWDVTSSIVDGTRERQSDDDPLCLEFYWWSRSQTQARAPLAAFRAVVTLKIGANSTLIEGRVCLKRGFVEQDVLTAASTPQLECWSPQKRVDAVTDWKPWVSVHGIYTRSLGYANGMNA